MEVNSNNRDFWNVVKGIGILCIVIGHTCHFLVPYVYLFHLVIFFFVSGYLYSEEKYGDKPSLNFFVRIISNWKKYFCFSVFFVLLHNIFFKFHFIIKTNKYSLLDIGKNLVNSIFFECHETLAGALWFVPVLIISSTIFGILIYIGRKIHVYFNKKFLKHLFILLIGLLFAILGKTLNEKTIFLTHHFQTSLLVIPIFILAYYIRKIKDINPFLKWYIFIPCVIFLYLCVNFFNFKIELSKNIIPGYIFFVISVAGIYACLYIAKIILKLKYLKKYFITIGKYSFEIMALHFLVIKIIDFIYAKIINETNPLIYGKFPYAYDQLYILYIIGCTIFPCFVMIFYEKLKKYVNTILINMRKSFSNS